MVNFERISLQPALYLVATPIGRARDITLHALDVLASADVLAAEDTRVLRRLMQIHGVPMAGRPLLTLHDHSGAGARATLVRHVSEGKSVAYCSDAGTPLVSDPGFDLVTAVRDAGGSVTMAPGPSALPMALALSGLPSDRFLFAGFLPNTEAARRRKLETLQDVPATLVFYENPKRVLKSLQAMAETLGMGRQAALCRELTKRFETVVSAPLGELPALLALQSLKGECVLLVGPPVAQGGELPNIDAALREALQTMHVKEAATVVAGAHGLKRRDVYQRALNLKVR
ncbi:MAG: 16S rRNA (cytidine(1402)-2'-O)-methyltransferase [Pseudomonadota bacterium]